jgi:hypothetical protein
MALYIVDAKHVKRIDPCWKITLDCGHVIETEIVTCGPDEVAWLAKDMPCKKCERCPIHVVDPND